VFIQDREEGALPPFRRFLCIDVEARGIGGQQAGCIVDGGFVGTARQAIPTGGFKLAGRVIAGVAYDAALVEYRLYGLLVGRVGYWRPWYVKACRIGRSVHAVQLRAEQCAAGSDQYDYR